MAMKTAGKPPEATLVPYKRKVGNWLRGYMEYTKLLEAPDLFHLWAAIGTLAGALRGKVFLDMGYFKWKPNFFIIFVAPPGIVSKSTSMGVGMGMLRKVKGIHFGPDSSTWQALTDAFSESTSAYKLGSKVYKMSPLTVAASELGTFLDPNNREMIDVLCDLWDGKDVPWRRRTRGEGLVEIPNPWFNFLGCTTTGWVDEHFPEYAISGGFTSRTVFVYADRKRRFTAYPKREMEKYGDDYANLYRNLVADLEHISTLKGEVTLTDAAYTWGEEWYRKHWEEKPEHLPAATFGGYLSRKQTHIHKTATVLSAAESSDLVILPEHLHQANALLTSLEFSMPNVFTSMSDNPEAKATALIIKVISNYPKGIDKSALYRSVMGSMGHDQFYRACRAAIDAGYVIEFGSKERPRLRPLERAMRDRRKAQETSSRAASLSPEGLHPETSHEDSAPEHPPKSEGGGRGQIH